MSPSVCIVGAGAIGGWIGTRLAAAGLDVSALARGATLEALRKHGWRMNVAGRRVQAPLKAASQSADELGPHDLVVVAVKATALTAVAPAFSSLLGASTIVLPAMNGVPWWLCHGRQGFETPLASVDPDGALARAIPFRHVVGCAVHATASTPEPGLVDLALSRGLIVGEPAGDHSDRVERIARLLTDAGIDAKHSPDVRRDLWYKLWGNMTMNPVSMLTGATTDRLLADPLVRAFCSAVMREAALVGEGIGCAVSENPEDRHAVTLELGAMKTSMLRDAEDGRAVELDAMVAAVKEIADRLKMPTPHIDILLGLARLHARVHGLHPEQATEG